MKLTKTQFEYYKKFCNEFNELNSRVILRIKEILNYISNDVNTDNLSFNIEWQDQFLIVSGFKLQNTSKINKLLLADDKLKLPLSWLYSDFEEDLRELNIKTSIKSKLSEKEIKFLQEKGIDL